MPQTIYIIAHECASIARSPADFISALVAKGYDVTVATADASGLDALSATQRIRMRPLPGAGPRNLLGWAGSYFIVQGELIERCPDLVLSFGSPWAFLGAFAGHRADVRAVIATLESLPAEEPLRALLARLPRRLRERAGHRTPIAALLSRWCDLIVMRDATQLEALLAIDGVDRRKVELIPADEQGAEERLTRLYSDVLARSAP